MLRNISLNETQMENMLMAMGYDIWNNDHVVDSTKVCEVAANLEWDCDVLKKSQTLMFTKQFAFSSVEIVASALCDMINNNHVDGNGGDDFANWVFSGMDLNNDEKTLVLRIAPLVNQITSIFEDWIEPLDQAINKED